MKLGETIPAAWDLKVMEYYTIKELEQITGMQAVELYQENKWITIVFPTGWRVKIKSF